MKAVRAVIATFVGLVTACSHEARILPPTGQIVLFIDTDAPLLDGATTADTLPPVPLFDHLRVDVYACADVERCPPITRDFAVDAGLLRAGNGVSFGIVPPPGGSALVRARLLSTSRNAGEDPSPDVTIDVTAITPTVEAEGIVEATLFLPTDQVGVVASDLDHPVPTTEGRPAQSAVGTWAAAHRLGCNAPAAPGEVCIPGGAFWMGSARLKDLRVWQDPAAGLERLVALQPFYIDAHEVTVAEFRASTFFVEAAWTESSDGSDRNDWCTFTKEVGAHDNRPVNCVSRRSALKYCESLDKELPTEAQFEYVAGGVAGHLWPWGNDVPSCGDAVVGRAFPPLIEPAEVLASAICRGATTVDGPHDVATTMRDVVHVPGAQGGDVFDLVGNLSEFARDVFQYRNESCWARPGVYLDPLCDTPGATTLATTVKGGNFWWVPAFSFAPARSPVAAPEADTLTGFRCVRRVD